MYKKADIVSRKKQNMCTEAFEICTTHESNPTFEHFQIAANSKKPFDNTRQSYLIFADFQCREIRISISLLFWANLWTDSINYKNSSVYKYLWRGVLKF